MEDRKGGFPHSEIAGSKGASASPALIAACHVLHRLSTPRHPSEALQRLIVSQQNSCIGCSGGWKEVSAGPTPDFYFVRRYLLEPDLKAYEGPVKFFLYNVNAANHATGCKLDMIARRSSSPQGGSTLEKTWWSQTESNRRHPACKAGALPTELWPLAGLSQESGRNRRTPIRGLVGPGRLELPTLRLSGVRSNHLSYGPMAVRQARSSPRLAIAPSIPRTEYPRRR